MTSVGHKTEQHMCRIGLDINHFVSRMDLLTTWLRLCESLRWMYSAICPVAILQHPSVCQVSCRVQMRRLHREDMSAPCSCPVLMGDRWGFGLVL